jgi:hypothetical protein
MSSAITKPQSIEPKTTIAPNYNTILSIPSNSQQPTVSKTKQVDDVNKTSSSDSKLWFIRFLIVICMLSVIIVTLTYVSSSRTNSYITPTTTADIS